MRVSELIAALKRLEGDPHVIINNKLISGISEVIPGRIGGARHWPDDFRPTVKGRERAVTFVRWEEGSDGEQRQYTVWT